MEKKIRTNKSTKKCKNKKTDDELQIEITLDDEEYFESEMTIENEMNLKNTSNNVMNCYTSKNIITDKNHIFKVAETFVGCGGSHFGFKKSGYETVFVNDIWEDAINTLKQNDTDLNENQIICDDIHNLNKEKFDNNGIDISNVDVFIGGVVCKGFSLAGIRNPYDERNYLYKQQLRLVEIIKPKISIIENVPGMLNMKILTKNNTQEIQNLCDELNEICENYKKIRGKLIAEKKKNTDNLSDEERDNLIKTIDDINTELKNLSKQRKENEKKLEDYKYSVIEDIERIYDELGYNVYKKILTCSEYGCFTNRQRLFIVAIRRDLNLEWTYPEPTTKNSKPTVRDAFNLIDYNGLNVPSSDVDNRPMKHNKNTIEKFKKIEAGGKSEEGYFSRGTSSRLSFDKPAPTLVPGHSAFQIHPTEHRSITVREGATITGFSTNFKFYGSHSSRCMQIGNAIPVTMAYTIAEQCKKILTGQI